MAKKCLVLIFILVYCINLFLPILSLAQVVEGSSFYNNFTTNYNNATEYFVNYSDKSIFQEAFEKSKENTSLLNALNTYTYWVCLPIIEFINVSNSGNIYFRYGVAWYFSDLNEFSIKSYTDYYRLVLSSNQGYAWFNCYYNNYSNEWTINEKVSTAYYGSSSGLSTNFRHYFTYSNKKYNLGLSADDYLSCVRSNYDLKYSDGTVAFYTDTSDIKFNVFDDSGIDWSSLFHYYVSTKKLGSEEDVTHEYNNRKFAKELTLFYKFDEFEGMISDGGLVSDYVSYIPSLKYEWIFKDKDGNVSSLETSWGGDGTYGRWLQFDLPFVCDESLGDVESVNSWFMAFLKMEYEYWIKTVLGDGTIQEFNDENSMKDYLDNKVEELWDKNGYLDYDLKVHVKIDKVDISDGVNIDVMWQDSFSLFYDTDNPNFVDIEDSFYVDTTEDEDKGFIDIVFDNDNNIVDVIDKSDIYDVTKDDKGNVTIINNNGDVIKNYGKDDDGNVVITDKDGNVIDIIENTTTFDVILDDLEAQGFDITGITEDMYGSTEELLKDVTKTSNLFKEVWYWLPFNMLSFVNVCLVILIVIKLLEFLRG